MLNQTKIFFQSEEGAVTVDWVVLTAAVVAFGTAVTASIQAGNDSVAEPLANHLVENVRPSTGF